MADSGQRASCASVAHLAESTSTMSCRSGICRREGRVASLAIPEQNAKTTDKGLRAEYGSACKFIQDSLALRAKIASIKQN